MAIMMERISCLLFLVLIPLTVLAGGKIKGRIFDRETAQPLIGANVVIDGTTSGAVTGPEGEFSIVDVTPGVYAVQGRFLGYAPLTVEHVRVLNGLTTEIELQLTASTLEIREITVIAQRPLVNTNATNAVRIFTGENIEAIPIRGIDNILALQPGVVLQDGTIHIRGSRPDEVGYYLEGVSVSDPQFGGSGISLSQEALEEVSVQSGGHEAEFGRANAGIVQYQLRSGGTEPRATLEYATDNISLQPRSNADRGDTRLGAYWYGYNELTGTVSGPVLTQRLKFFGLVNYLYNRNTYPQAYSGVSVGPVKDAQTGDSINWVYPAGTLLKSSTENTTFTSTLSVDLNPLVLRISGSYSKAIEFTGGNPSLFMDLARVPEADTWNGFWSGKGTYFLTPTTYVELTGGMLFYTRKVMDPILRDDFFSYGDSVANALAGVIWSRKATEQGGRYATPAPYLVDDFSFAAPGTPLASYTRLDRNALSFSAAFSTQIGASHTVKAGGDFQRFTIRAYQPAYPQTLAYSIAHNNQLPDGDPSKVSVADILRTGGTNVYGYDLLGRKYDGSDFMGPRHPVYASMYLQDKMEFSDLVVNAGLRYDYSSTNAYELIDPSRPELTYNLNTLEVDPRGLKKSPPFHAFSPRLGVGFPVSDRTVFHVQYAGLVQQPRLRDVNMGLYALGLVIKSGVSEYPVGIDLRPTRTTQYEAGFCQQIGDFASFDVTGFYKDIKDQVVMDLEQVAQGSSGSNYPVFTNGDYATTKGVEIAFTMRRRERLLASAALSLQDAEGSGSYPNSNWAIVTGSTNQEFRPQYVAPLAYEQALAGNINVDYRFGAGDGGPILQELGASLLITFNSGHPYTRTATPVTGRFAVEPVNSSTTPWFFQMDMRIDKTVRIAGRLGMTAYIYVINLLDTRNILNVFPATGSPTDDGVIYNPESGGKAAQAFGPRYVDMYRAYNIDYSNPGVNSPVYFLQSPQFYGPPRQIRFGLRLEY